MSSLVRFGESAEFTIPLDDERLIAVCAPHAAEAITSQPIEAATREALANPLKYPMLTQAVVEGDKVTIALDRGVPHSAEIVRVIAEQLLAASILPADITVLQSDRTLPGERLELSNGVSIHIELHDPLDRGKLSYLTNTRSGRPIYLNRLVADAEMVIPVGCFRGREAWDYRGIFGGLYPTFSDADAHKRFRNAHLLDSRSEMFEKSQQEIELVGRQTGTQFTVQVVPQSGSGTPLVLAGEATAVARRGEELWNDTWNCEVPRTADLVVAALSGEGAQSWANVGKALAMALEVVEDGGAVALCTELAEPLGPALDLFTKQEDRDTAGDEIRKVRPADAFPALLLAEAQRRVRVYLLSKLDATTVEDLGIAPVAEAADVARLALRRKSCIIVNDAQYTNVRLEQSVRT
ncbi:MAG: lactate racemase domain-containing protein [Planctomycetia bacterium]|nr:lactate racemase domain-containing protein [Planctomycetia bacterium]